MTLPPDFHPASRTRLLQVAAATWLLLVSAAVVVNHVALSRLAGDVRTIGMGLRSICKIMFQENGTLQQSLTTHRWKTY